jgi:hypothetical protein
MFKKISARRSFCYDMRMNKKRLFITASILLAVTLVVFFGVRLWIANTSNYIPGSVTVIFKPEYRDRATVEAAAKSIDGTVNYNDGIRDIGWYDIRVKTGKEEEAVRKLSTRPQIDHAYRSMYARADI